MCCVVESRMFVEIIDRALLRLRKYPDRGELYYEILTKQFIYRFNSTEKEMLEELNMERSVFYDRKKEAIYIFSVCLFGYAIPEGVGKTAPTNFRLNPDKVPTESLLHSDFVPAITGYSGRYAPK